MKKYTMDDFITGKLAVRVNKDNIMDFLKMCEEKRIVWQSGDKATKGGNVAAKCIACGLYGDNKLTFSLLENSPTYSDDGYTFVDFSQIIKPVRYQITIESDGETTTAKMVVNGKEVKQATAKRNPADKPNWHIGAQTAFDRLWQKQPKPEKLKKVAGFKVGDRVVVSQCAERIKVIGQHGCVVTFGKVGDDELIGVELDNRDDLGHQCVFYANDHKPHAKYGHGMWFKPIELRHENPTRQKVREVYRKAKKDEWVRIVKKIHCTDCRYKNGDVLRVVREGDCLDDLSCGGAGAHYVEYVVLEGYQPGRDGK